MRRPYPRFPLFHAVAEMTFAVCVLGHVVTSTMGHPLNISTRFMDWHNEHSRPEPEPFQREEFFKGFKTEQNKTSSAVIKTVYGGLLLPICFVFHGFLGFKIGTILG